MKYVFECIIFLNKETFEIILNNSYHEALKINSDIVQFIRMLIKKSEFNDLRSK